MATTDDIKKLRDQTGISVMQCKQALEEAGGDSAKALVILQKKGGALAAKKADRSLGAGTISAYVHSTKEVGSLIELQSETDFVAKNPEFIALAYDIAMHTAAAKPLYVRREDVEEEKMKTIRDMFEKEVEGKAEHLKEQILAGKVNAYLKNIVLLEQPFIKDPEKTIADLVHAAVQKFGERIEVTRSVYFSLK